VGFNSPYGNTELWFSLAEQQEFTKTPLSLSPPQLDRGEKI